MITLFATILTVLGGIDLFLRGVGQFDFIAFVFGGPATVGARIAYIVIGLAALWVLSYLIRVHGRMGTKL